VRVSGSGEYEIAAQIRVSGTQTVLVENRIPGTIYDVGTRACNGPNKTDVIEATGSPFTAQLDTSLPSGPTNITVVAGDDANDRPPPITNSSGLLVACTVHFVQSTDPRVNYYEFVVTSVDTDSAANVVADGGDFRAKCPAGVTSFFRYKGPAGGAQYLRGRAIRIVAGSAYAGPWVRAAEGDISAKLKAPAGDVLLQNKNAVNFTGGSMTGMTTLGTTSSQRWKTNIRTIARPLVLIWRLRGVVFDRTDLGMRRDLGLIAEEVFALEELRSVVCLDEEGRPASIDYGKLVGLCVAALRQLAAAVALILVVVTAIVAWLILHG
jgi:hypothetical protein